MYKQLIICALLVCANALPRELPVDVNRDWRIVGGSPASTGQFPYIVSMRMASGTHICGGSILNAFWILTAAHCVVSGSTASLSVQVGTNLIDSGGVSIGLSRILVHASYNPNTFANDISVLNTASAIGFSSLVTNIPLSTAMVGGGVSVVLSGWGLTSNPGLIPNALQFINLLTITNANCVALQTPDPIFTTQICTLTQAGQGACMGDSGGPLVLNSNGAQVGIVSWGRPCAIGFPDVYTRVPSFISWIVSAINS